MISREEAIKRHKADIERMRESIEWMEAGNEEIGERSPSGKLISLNAETIDYYKRTIETLERVIATLEAKNY
ncbi:MAG: hypothetical protein E5W43_22525 [Mesorhizobium sp.]|nr:MAG: hypothetical protein E5W43_22525 [Mesorhizobium sp.]